jgi:RNA recognition motif-containing protein
MNIYVGNLAYRVREDDLKSVFEQFGSVSSARVITDRDSGRSKGYAFVDMPDDGEAQQAIRELNEKDLEGRRLIVKESIPRK